MAGIASVDTNHLQTTELNYFASGSLDNSLLAPYTTLSGFTIISAPTTAPCRSTTMLRLSRPSTRRGFTSSTSKTTPRPVDLRTQAWWAALSGANAGQMYGNERTAYFAGNWQANLDTPGAAQFIYLKSLLTSHPVVQPGAGSEPHHCHCGLRHQRSKLPE